MGTVRKKSALDLRVIRFTCCLQKTCFALYTLIANGYVRKRGKMQISYRVGGSFFRLLKLVSNVRHPSLEWPERDQTSKSKTSLIKMMYD